MRRLFFLLQLIFVFALVGCGESPPARLSDEDVDRIAAKTADVVMKRMVDQGSDDLAYRLHQKMKDLTRVEAPAAAIAQAAVPVPPAPLVLTAVPTPEPTPTPPAPPTPAPASTPAPPPATPTPPPTPAPPAPAPSASATPAPSASATPAPSAAASPAATPAGVPSFVIVRIDAQSWTQAELVALARARNIALDTSNGRDFAEELVSFELSAIEATAAKTEADPEFQRRVKSAVDEYIAHALYREKMATMPPVTDDLLRERYQRQLGLFTSRENAQVEEFWAPTKDDVAQVVAKLKVGEDFAALQKSGQLPATIKTNGRSTVRPGQYPVDVYRKLRTMAPGTFSEPFANETGGFIVLRLMLYQPEIMVPFEKAKDRLRAQIEQERLQEALKAVEDEAKRLIPVKMFTDRFGNTDSQVELVEVGDQKVTRNDVLREMASLPDNYRARFSTKEGFADLVDRVAQKVLFSLYANKHLPDFMARHKPQLDQIEKQERVRVFLERELGTRVKISEADMKAYYDRHASAWKVNEARLRNISFRAQTAEERATMAGKANQALDRLKKGEAFEKVAAALSDDTETKNRGGDMGWLSSEQMPPELQKLVPNMQAGTTTPVPVQSSGAFHLIKVEAKRDVKPFEEVRASIESQMRGERQREVFGDLIVEWKKRHRVELALDRLALPPPPPSGGRTPVPVKGTIQMLPATGGAK